MGNIHHDARGRFSSGSSATGDHQASQSVQRAPRLAVTRHDVPSVGTEPPRITLRPAARDRIIRGKLVDQTHRPYRTDAEVTSRTDFGRAGPTPGRVQPYQLKLKV
jgi:hypothetical protein